METSSLSNNDFKKLLCSFLGYCGHTATTRTLPWIVTQADGLNDKHWCAVELLSDPIFRCGNWPTLWPHNRSDPIIQHPFSSRRAGTFYYYFSKFHSLTHPLPFHLHTLGPPAGPVRFFLITSLSCCYIKSQQTKCVSDYPDWCRWALDAHYFSFFFSLFFPSARVLWPVEEQSSTQKASLLSGLPAARARLPINHKEREVTCLIQITFAEWQRW